MLSYRDGIKFGIMLAIRTFNTMPCVKAIEGLIGTYNNIDTIVDEDGNPIAKEEE